MILLSWLIIFLVITSYLIDSSIHSRRISILLPGFTWHFRNELGWKEGIELEADVNPKNESLILKKGKNV